MRAQDKIKAQILFLQVTLKNLQQAYPFLIYEYVQGIFDTIKLLKNFPISQTLIVRDFANNR